jgi:hypothetical protein
VKLFCTRNEGRGERRGITQLTGKADIIWRCMINFTLQPPYFEEKNGWYQLNKRMGGARVGQDVPDKRQISCFCRLQNRG